MKRDFDTIIIGGGPAGLTAAVYALRAGLSAAIFEKQFIGGQAALTSDIENFPGFISVGGQELTELMHKQAIAHGAITVSREARSVAKGEDGLFTVETKKQPYTAATVIYAAGASPRKLGIEDGFEGAGVSYCATCDGNFYKGKTVAVIGGGNTALEDALYLSRIVKKVYLIHRRNEFRAGRIMIERAENAANIETVMETVPVMLEGIPGERVTGVRVKNAVSGEEKSISVDGIFMAVGQEPKSALLAGVAELDGGGYVVCDERMRTSVPGLFAAGDVRVTPLRQVITACADGAVAANEAAAYIAENF